MVLFEGALFWVEVEVISAKPIEDLSDQGVMASDVFFLHFSLFVPGVNCYVVHIDCDVPSINEVLEYGVHHGLEGG